MKAPDIPMSERRKAAFNEIASKIDSLSAMADYFGVTPPAIARWKREGIPEARVPYFMLRYPKLDAWKGLPRGT